MQRVGEQFVDFLDALVGTLVRRKGADLIGRRQPANGVDRHAAQELSVGAQIGRYHVEQPEPGENFAIDVVALGDLRVGEAGGQLHRHQHPHGLDVSPVGDDDRRAAGPEAFHEAEVGGPPAMASSLVRKSQNG